MKENVFERYMTPEEWALFETNYKGEPYKEPFEEYLKKFEYGGSFNEFIASAFSWYETEQGDSYWEDIAVRKIPLNKE